MISLFPHWVLVLSAAAGICVFVTGRVRLAVALASPALIQFLLWPTARALLAGIPMILIIVAAVVAIPVIIVRSFRRLLIIFVGEQAADHAIGHSLGVGLVHLFRRRRNPD